MPVTDTMPSLMREKMRLAAWARLLPRAPGQINGFDESDAELLPLPDGSVLAATVDTVDEEVRMGLYGDPRTVGRVAVTATLSDLAAVGARPLGLLLSVGLPADAGPAVQAALAAGVREACAVGAVEVLGGDTNETLSLTAGCVGLGLIEGGAPMTRQGAQCGDHLFVSGPIGDGGALAAARLLGAPSDFPERDFRPAIRCPEGQALRGIASACMDTSDGLLTTLDTLARVNGGVMCVDAPIPELLSPRTRALADALSLPPLVFAASPHGEFELVFTVPPTRLTRLGDLCARIGWQPLWLGRVARRGNPEIGLRVGGRPICLEALHRAAGQPDDACDYARRLAAACAVS